MVPNLSSVSQHVSLHTHTFRRVEVDESQAEMERKEGTKAFQMLSGTGHNSYVYNSSYQRSSYDSVKGMIEDAIHETFDISSVKSAIRIVDLGCSVGPNTFCTVQHIIDAMCAKLKVSSNDQAQACEFQVFFNDLITNDFNMLFSTTPPDRRYFAAGLPGAFHSRLLPRDSVHFFNSTMALHWLSRSPPGVANKGRVEIYGGGPAVLRAYAAQFRADMEAFLMARAEELVGGGLMALVFLCRPEGLDLATVKLGWVAMYVEPTIRELVDEGKLKEEDLDTFQCPLYYPTVEEFKEMVEMNGQYSIHVAKIVDQRLGIDGSGEDGCDVDIETQAKFLGDTIRAGSYALVSAHFGDEKAVEEVFLRLPATIHHHLVTCDPLPSVPPLGFLILQRNPRLV